MKKIFLLTTILAGSLFSATFNVSTTPELRTALSTAATNGEDDTIVLADGTYKTTDDGQGTFIYLSNESNSLTLQGSSADNVILSGDSTHQILNHQSTENAPMTLEELSFIDGNNTSGNGGGVYTDYSIEVIDCNFSNNIATNGSGFYLSPSSAFSVNVNNSDFYNNSASNDGGGFYAYANTYSYINVTNSKFKSNNAVDGGGFYAYSYPSTIINSSLFEDNNVTGKGGGFISRDIEINNSIFKRNNANSGGGVYANMLNSKAIIINSIFDSNNANSGGGIYASTTSYWNDKASILNSLFLNNINNIYLAYGEQHKVINNIFYNNSNYNLSGNSDAIVNINYNYIDELLISITNFKSNNIYNAITLGFIDKENEDYRLTSASNLIDKGTNDLGDGLSILSSKNCEEGINQFEIICDQGDGSSLHTNGIIYDLDGNARLAGASVDIGPYEFTTTKPTINSFIYTGTAQELNELTFNTNYTLTDGRYINSVSYDFENNDTWTTSNTHTFSSAGTYTVKVKITDSEGEFSIQSKEIIITELPFTEMTYEQKLIKAINTSYYEEIIALINSNKNVSIEEATTSGIATGEANVKANPSTFGLITIADKDTAVASAIEQGKQLVLSNPSSFGLELKEPLTKSKIDSLSTGWHNISNPSEVTDLSIFDNASIVWIFNSTSNSWEAYSSNSSYKTLIQNDSTIKLATKINAAAGIWVLK